VTISFFAEGKPEPQGSAKGFAFMDKRTGKPRAVVTSDNAKLKPWRLSVQGAARRAMAGAGLSGRVLSGAITVAATFRMPPPQAAAARLRKGKRVPCIVRPDTDKLARGLLDSLTGLVFADDSQVVELRAAKVYAHPDATPGVRVEVSDAAPVTETVEAPTLFENEFPELPEMPDEE
jgi:Holliday junction resolvase RusA-like endonuclease